MDVYLICIHYQCYDQVLQKAEITFLTPVEAKEINCF